ncbi:uncharacterized protein [Dermacentor albipictus]|uniref:uncharacterized protein isoform X2 n=1 Tax=Dermacentor albipictus TaxID=60249 RepID=UPI0031FC6338
MHSEPAVTSHSQMVSSFPCMADFEAEKFLGRPVGFRILSDDIAIVDHAIQRATALLPSLLAPWQCLDAARTFVLPVINFKMRCGSLGKDDWQRPLLKTYLLVNAASKHIYGCPHSRAAANCNGSSAVEHITLLKVQGKDQLQLHSQMTDCTDK